MNRHAFDCFAIGLASMILSFAFCGLSHAIELNQGIFI